MERLIATSDHACRASFRACATSAAGDLPDEHAPPVHPARARTRNKVIHTTGACSSAATSHARISRASAACRRTSGIWPGQHRGRPGRGSGSPGPFGPPATGTGTLPRGGTLREPAFMSHFFPAHATRHSEPPGPRQPARPAVYWRALRTADRACCCPARPSVVAVMPAALGRDHPTDLLLCGHHYRVYRRALAAAGAVILDLCVPRIPSTALTSTVA